MTIQRLEQYAALRCEVVDLEMRIMRLKEKNTIRVSDTVRASMPEFPYTEHTVTVKGYAERSARHLSRVITLLAKQKAALSQELIEIETWIPTVTDSRTRQLIRHYYIDGKTWEAAATAVYGHPFGDAARMRVRRYCEKYL